TPLAADLATRWARHRAAAERLQEHRPSRRRRGGAQDLQRSPPRTPARHRSGEVVERLGHDVLRPWPTSSLGSSTDVFIGPTHVGSSPEMFGPYPRLHVPTTAEAAPDGAVPVIDRAGRGVAATGRRACSPIRGAAPRRLSRLEEWDRRVVRHALEPHT